MSDKKWWNGLVVGFVLGMALAMTLCLGMVQQVVPSSASSSATAATIAPDPVPPSELLTEALAATPAPTIVRMKVTAYCPCTKCCGPNAQGITASGQPVSANGGKFCAAPKNYKFGTLLDIPGYGVVPVLDRGGAIKGNRLDVYFPTHQEALEWGVKELEVEVVDE